MIKQLKISIIMILVMSIITGLIYPLTITLLAQVFFSSQANGSLIFKDKNIIGSKLIGQSFTEAKYFHPRPSESDYNASLSGGSNLGPTSKKLIDKITSNHSELQKENPNSHVPIDLVTESASGLDPEITPEAALFQIPRIAKVRNISEEQISKLINKHTEHKLLGIFGEERVNVLLLNLALDDLKSI